MLHPEHTAEDLKTATAAFMRLNNPRALTPNELIILPFRPTYTEIQEAADRYFDSKNYPMAASLYERMLNSPEVNLNLDILNRVESAYQLAGKPEKAARLRELYSREYLISD